MKLKKQKEEEHLLEELTGMRERVAELGGAHPTWQNAKSVVDTVREPLVVLDGELRVLSANRSFYQTFQVPAEETAGQLLYDLGNRQWDIPALRKLLEEILPGNTTVEGFEMEHEFETIGRRSMLLNARRLYCEADQIQMVLLAIEDVTERKRAKEASREARDNLEIQVKERTAELKQAAETLGRLNRELDMKNKELESVLYVASHDLWSPLVNIKGFSGELNQACKTVLSLVADARLPEDRKEQLTTIMDEQFPRALEFIVASVTKMDKLLAGLLRLSRLGQAALQFEHLDMNAMLSDIAKSFEFQIRDKGATLQIDTLPLCLGDATQINQVFSNLLDNALKYLDPARSGVIRVHGQQKERLTTYCVEDNGIGIAPEHYDNIFETFRRLDPEGPVAGEGLGLAIVRRILDRHNGKIWLESESGKGTRFFVSLTAQVE